MQDNSTADPVEGIKLDLMRDPDGNPMAIAVYGATIQTNYRQTATLAIDPDGNPTCWHSEVESIPIGLKARIEGLTSSAIAHGTIAFPT